MPEESQSFSKSAGGKRKALHKKYIVGAHRAPLQLRTQAVGAVYDRPGFFVQSPSAMVKLFMKRNTRHDRGRRDGIADGGAGNALCLTDILSLCPIPTFSAK